MRLIDADALKAELWKERASLQMMDDSQTADKIMYGIYKAERCASKMPSVDAEPVRYGRWIEMPLKEDKTADVTAYYEPIVCSVCGSQNNCKSAYCPNCGAKMDGGEDGRQID